MRDSWCVSSPRTPREQPVVFDFASWPVSRQLQTAFADALRARTRVGSRVRALQSAKTLHQVFRTFGTYLGTLDSPPARPNQLTRAHLDGWRLTRNQGSSDPNGLKSLLRHIEGLESDFRDAVNEASPTRNRGALSSYSREENRRILQTARADVRAAAMRIRAGRGLLAEWRRGMSLTTPRRHNGAGNCWTTSTATMTSRASSSGVNLPKNWVWVLGSVADHFAQLHLTSFDVGAFAVLLVGLTGQNPPRSPKRPLNTTAPMAMRVARLLPWSNLTNPAADPGGT